MRGCEIRGFRWSDVDLLSDTLTIRKSKTAAGVRTIPLTRAALEVFIELRKRAELFGDVIPEHFIFARFKPVGRFDGKELRKCALRDLIQHSRSVAGKRHGALSQVRQDCRGLRFHDLRHHLITELCESGASEQTIKAIAGHVSQRMLDRYSHIRLDAKRQALEALAQARHVTSYDTKSGHSQPLSSQTTDSIGRRVRI